MTGLVWAPRAQRDLRALIAWYQRFDPDLPKQLIDEIEAAAHKLIDFPLLGAALADGIDRKWHARGTPFILIYRPTRTGVRVLHVVHEATNCQERR